jgi:tetratricopeptide (TPR) repeat protein
MRAAAPALLPSPWLTLEPLYPGGFFPPLCASTRTASGGLAQRLDEAAAVRLRMDWPAARAAAEHAAALALEAGDAAGEADAQLELAGTELLAGETDEAGRLYRQLAEGATPAAQRFRAALGLAAAAGIRGDFDAALEGIAAAEAAGGSAGDADLAITLANRAAALVGAGRLRKAEDAAAEALRAGRRLRDEHLAAVGHFALALAHLSRGRRGDARTRLAEAVRAFAKNGDVLRQVQCHHLLGEIAYDGEDPIRAGSHYRDALGLARLAGALEAVELLTLRFEHR